MPESCEENQRFVRWSMKPIGSSDAADEVGKLTSFHVAVPGEVVSSNVVCRASSPAWYITLPVFMSPPSDGSPAPVPIPAGGW